MLCGKSRVSGRLGRELSTDRKSTRLNSSHLGISYAVFCLKKKPVRGALPAGRRRRDRQEAAGEAGPGPGREPAADAFFFLNDRAPPGLSVLPARPALPD